MSTLKVSTIKNASSATGGLSIAADGVVSGALPSPNRNLLYNGAMQVAQRGTSVSGVTTGQVYRTVDRFYLAAAGVGFGTVTESVETDAPTGSGFRKSYKTLWTTGKTPLAASDLLLFRQILEGQDLQRIAKGTSSAQQLTLSFWVKSNVTGTYVARLEDTDNSRHVAATYSVNASGTWEKKTITFPADTTGAFDNDNAGSLRVDWVLAVGTDWTSGTLPAAWGSYLAANLAPGQTNVAAATNNYWQITGVQLEVGDTATEFEFKSYGQELAECQRYYEASYAIGVAPGTNTSTGRDIWNLTSDLGSDVYFDLVWKVSKRAAPTITSYTTAGTSGSWTYERSGVSATSATAAATNISQNSAVFYVENVGATWAAVQIYGHYTVISEL